MGASFLRTDNAVLTASGQLAGTAATIRLVDQSGSVWVLVGAGEQPIQACTGRVDGLFTGPLSGDIGDWHGTFRGLGTGSGAQPASGDTAGQPPPVATEPAAAVCRAVGEPCDGDGDCCIELCREGLCTACSAVGQYCAVAADQVQQPCCDGLVCAAMQCFIPDGSPCISSSECKRACVNGICGDDPPCADTGASCAELACCLGYCNQDLVCECVGAGAQCAGIGTGGCCSLQPCNAAGVCP